MAACLFLGLSAGCTPSFWYPKYAKPITIDGKELVIVSTTVGEFVSDGYEVIRTKRQGSYLSYQHAIDEEKGLSPAFGIFVDPERYEIDPAVDEVVEETPGSGNAVYMLTKGDQYYGIFSVSIKRKGLLSEAVIASYEFDPFDAIPVEQWPEIVWEGNDLKDITPELVENFTTSIWSDPPKDYFIMPHGPVPSNPRGAGNGMRLGDVFWTEISFSRDNPDRVRSFEINMR